MLTISFLLYSFAVLIEYNLNHYNEIMNGVIWSGHIKQKCQQIADCSVEGAIKTITETKNDLVFLYNLWYSAVFSGKVAMATGHDILTKSLKTCIHVAWPVAMDSFALASLCRLALPLTVL
jgi:hypothetical protein